METSRRVRIQEALDEGRTLILGAQIMLGMLYRGVFEPGFDSLPYISRILVALALLLVVAGFVLLTWPVAYHRIVDRGHDSPGLLHFIDTITKPSLVVIGASMGVTIYVATGKLLGSPTGIVVAASASCFGFLSWRGGKQRRPARRPDSSNENTPLDGRIRHVLTEARMVLPGAQALLGFQFITTLLGDFDRLPWAQKLVHLVSLLLTSLSVILLMTPAARHRIVEQGADTEEFHRFAGRVLLAAMVPLALGIAGDLFVVIAKVTASIAVALTGATLVLALALGAWFGYTSYLLTKSHRRTM